jgi:hypothetical protein
MYGSSSSLGTTLGGPASTWSTSAPGANGTRRGGLGIVAARVHDHVVATAAEGGRERMDVDVLPAGVDAAQGGEGAGVLGHHRDPHAIASCAGHHASISASQSARKRSRP